MGQLAGGERKATGRVVSDAGREQGDGGCRQGGESSCWEWALPTTSPMPCLTLGLAVASHKPRSPLQSSVGTFI